MGDDDVGKGQKEQSGKLRKDEHNDGRLSESGSGSGDGKSLCECACVCVSVSVCLRGWCPKCVSIWVNSQGQNY